MFTFAAAVAEQNHKKDELICIPCFVSMSIIDASKFMLMHILLAVRNIEKLDLSLPITSR